MAQGDIKADVVTVPISDNMVVQPAASEHWIIKQLVSSGWGNGALHKVELTDGTTSILLFPEDATPADGILDLLASHWSEGTASDKASIDGILINNDLYLKVTNEDGGGAHKFIYTAIQIK